MDWLVVWRDAISAIFLFLVLVSCQLYILGCENLCSVNLTDNSDFRLETNMMDQMYAVKPYVSFYEDIRPPDVMYSLKSYHSAPLNNGVLDSSSGQVPSVRQEGLDETLRRRQLELIEELTAFVGRLNKVLSSRPVSSSKHGSTYLKEDAACRASQKQFAYRKNGMNALPREKMGTNCLLTMSTFKSSKCPKNITLIGGADDKKSLEYLAKVGAKASIFFEGFDNEVISPVCTIKFQTTNGNGTEDLVAEVDGIRVTGRVSVWKLLGGLVALYPATRECADICTHIDQWLVRINDVLSGRSDEDSLCRRMSVALGNCDYLVPDVAASFADILAYSVISKQAYYANNVELWLQRMDKLLR